MPTVSVIIPVYNRPKKIKLAARSVLQQTFSDLELVLINDGSTDNTEATLDELSRTDKRIRVINNRENSGVSFARNRGIKASQGEFIALLDSDDSWEKNKLELQMALFKNSPGTDICHTDEIWIRNGKRVNPKKKHKKPDGRVFLQSLPLCAVSPSSIIIRKSILKETDLFDVNLPACEDYDLWLQLSARHNFFLIDKQLVIKTGGHEDQLSAKYWGMDRFRITALLKVLDSPLLTAEERLATIKMINEKATILALGFTKHNKPFLATIYKKLADQFAAS